MIYDSELLKYIFNNANVGIAICNAKDNRLEMVNPTFAKIHGYEQHELIGAMPGEVFASESMLRLSEHEKNPVCNSNNDITFETTHIKKDGTPVNVSVHITIIKDENGEVRQRIANIIDISRRTKSERVFKDTNSKLDAIFSTIPDMIWMKDANGKYIASNNTFQKVFGKTENEIIGQTDYDFFSKEEADSCRISDIEAIQTKETINCQETITDPKSGQKVILEIRKKPVYDSENNLIGILGIGRDVTERTIFEERLASKEREFRTLAQNANIPIYRYDRECRRIYVNPAVEKLSNKRVSDLLGKTPLESSLIHPDYNDALMTSLHKVLDTGQNDAVELLFILPDGTKKYFLHNHVAEYNSFGHIESVLAIGHDITAQKELESREEMFRTLAENSPNIIMRYDGDAKRIYANPAFAKHTGIPLEQTFNNKPDRQWGVYLEMLNMGAYEYQERVKKVFQTGKSDNFTVEWIRYCDGVKVAHDLNLVAEKDNNGYTIGVLAIGHDITKKLEAERELKESEQNFKSLTENIPDNIVRWDLEGRYLYINPRHEKTLEMSAEDVVGNKMSELFGTHSNVAEALEYVIKTGEGVFGILQSVQYRNGTEEIHEVNIIPELDSSGNMVSVLGIGRDITELKRSEENLQKTKAKLGAVISTLPDLIWVKDINGIYMMCNSEFENFFGASQEEIIGKTDYDFISKEQADFFRQKDKEAICAGEMCINEEEIVFASNGKYALLETRKIPVYNGEEFMGILGIGRDITERKKMEEQLLEQNRFLDSLLNAIPVPIFYKDTETRYKGFNKAFEEFYGKKKEELIGKGVFDLFHPEQAQVFFDADADIFRHGGTQIYETKLQDARGVDHYVMFHKSVYFDHEGTVAGLIGTILDITERKAQENALAQQEQQFRTITEHTPDTIARYNKECIRTYANPAMVKMMKKEGCELIGTKPTHYYNSHEALAYEKVIQRVFTTGIEEDFEYSWPDVEQNFITSLIRLVPEIDSQGVIQSVLATGRDITNLKKYEVELKKQKDFQDTLLKGVAKAGMSVNVLENGRYIYTNNIELAKEYGYDDNFLENKPSFLETIHPDDKEKVAQMYQKRLSGEQVPTTYTIRQINKQGETKEHEISVVLIPNTNPVQTLVVNKDVTEQKNIEKRIEFMAHHDTLTGLPNRVLLKDRAEMILSQAKRNIKKTAFLFIDLDGFKTINDSLGHSIGDIVLKAVAHRIQSCIRATDTLSRYGGDEFIVVIPEVTNKDEVESVTGKIINEFKKSFEINNQVLSITASVGIAMYPEHGNNFEHLLQNADSAMYKAKENGKNTYCFFTQQMKHNLLGIFRMQNDLKEAIRNKEFILHYQPQVDLARNKIVGAEALIRWKHPSMGMIPPMNFISVAESCGYIVEIGEWVIQEACRQCMIWNKNGKDIVVAVNVSAVQFKRGNLIEVVKNALEISGLNPKYLELELTESILISDTENVLQSVRAIKELGVQLSIDDFGTGYSSLAYLKRFAVDKLKIDQSFVRDIVKDKEDSSIVKTIIQMAKSFNLKSIAEGVENEEVLEVLKEFGCDEVQGYHFAKPMIADDFRDYYKKLNKKDS
jgi:diguanylate cyclase (GGDEF)-like protein/PAS domain S-box-containing protein